MVFPLVALSVISAFWRTSTSSSAFNFGMSALFKWYLPVLSKESLYDILGQLWSLQKLISKETSSRKRIYIYIYIYMFCIVIYVLYVCIVLYILTSTHTSFQPPPFKQPQPSPVLVYFFNKRILFSTD